MLMFSCSSNFIHASAVKLQTYSRGITRRLGVKRDRRWQLWLRALRRHLVTGLSPRSHLIAS